MPVNITSIKTSSNGAWQGDNPLNFAFPLLIVQTTLVLVLTRSLAFLLKPLRQPKVIAEIIGGILLGPSALGRNQAYMHRIFPSWSTPILESVASIGLLFFLFLVGLELDLASIRRSGKRAFSIAAAGITLPFVLGIGVAFILRKTITGADQVGFSQFLVFMGVALSITAFPVLARILAELKLLTTSVGETAMSAAAFNDVVAWVLLALAVALSGNGANGSHKSPLISLWVLLSGVAFVVFMMTIIRPLMQRVARQCTPEVDELYICLTLAGVMVSGFVTDAIGIHSIFGAFVFGLAIPKEGEFAERLMERIEDLVSGLLLPLYFASSGLKTNVATIKGGEAWGLLVLVIFTACAGKILGTFFVAVLNKIPVREAWTLGLLMNTKGLVELIVLNIGKERKVLNDEIFAILVLMALFTTFMTTPTVMAVYKPARANIKDLSLPIQSLTTATKKQLRLLACVHGPAHVPSLFRLVESTRTQNSPLKLYVMHLIELTERSSSITLTRRARRDGLPFLRRDDHPHDPVTVAFQAYARLGRVTVRPVTAISALATMHEDVCHVAEDKGVGMVILPFEVGPAWRAVNQRVLRHAPCSVAVLVDRGLGSSGDETPAADGVVGRAPAGSVCVVFFGGPDDREALGLGERMAGHPEVRVTVVRFVESSSESDWVKLKPSPEKSRESSYSFSLAALDRGKEKELDETAISEFRKRCEKTVEYVEREASGNIVEEVVGLGRRGEYELMVVGKGRFPSNALAVLAESDAVHPELGPIGDALAASNGGVVPSVLVIQQHDIVHAEEVPVSMVGAEDEEAGSSLDSINKV